ncbi:hypothetical protein ACUNWD_19935 [Sunxiuqinia sp. A32]|uniref:hypothetical protein n=1 Tax=Sunxiuqinia sp. A32 TaxID=3461496 RepID=UPI004045B605
MTNQEFYDLLDSWENIEVLLQYLIDYPKHIRTLIDIGLKDSRSSSWRAIWLADKIHEKQAHLIQPYIPELITSLRYINNESKKRHLLKLISLNKMPEEELSFLLEYCINEFTAAERPIAIRVHAMQVLFEISELEPDFKAELIQIIEHEKEYHGSAGIHSRGNKLLKKLEKQTMRN